MDMMIGDVKTDLTEGEHAEEMAQKDYENLMDMMIGDVKTDLIEGEHAEEMAQKDYENLMAASQKTRATNAESITEKESASSEWMEKIENAKTDQASTTEALAKLKEYIAGLHSSR